MFTYKQQDAQSEYPEVRANLSSPILPIPTSPRRGAHSQGLNSSPLLTEESSCQAWFLNISYFRLFIFSFQNRHGPVIFSEIVSLSLHTEYLSCCLVSKYKHRQPEFKIQALEILFNSCSFLSLKIKVNPNRAK